MKITYLGHSCFCITGESGVSVITDPYTRVGYELPKGLTADIVLCSHQHFDHNYVEAIEGFPEVVTASSIGTVNGVEISGYDTWHDEQKGKLRGKNVVFQFTIEGITFCHFGDLGQAYSKEMDAILYGADVWLIPVGGKYTIDAEQAIKYIEEFSPKLVIPMHYRPEDGALDIAGIDNFLSKVDKNRVICCENGELLLDKVRLEEWTGKIIYMERKK